MRSSRRWRTRLGGDPAAAVAGRAHAGELASSFEMTKPSMSHHFTVLKEADLIRSRRDGQQIYYSLNTTVLEDVLTRLWDHLGLKNAKGERQAMTRVYWIARISHCGVGGGRRRVAVSQSSRPDPDPLEYPMARSTATAANGRCS